MPAKWYVVLMVIMGIVGLLLGIADQSKSESLSSLLPFGMATFTYLFYIRR